MSVSRGGFSLSSMTRAFSVGGSLSHSSLMVDLSRMPWSLDGCRFLRIVDGECTSLYAFVASRPAYFRMTFLD